MPTSSARARRKSLKQKAAWRKCWLRREGKTMLEALQRALSIPELKRRIQFVLGMFLIFAIGAHIPVPGVDHNKLAAIMGRGGGGNLLGLVDVFSGGALRRMSIFAMGIGPYINASIIMQ